MPQSQLIAIKLKYSTISTSTVCVRKYETTGQEGHFQSSVFCMNFFSQETLQNYGHDIST